MGKLIKIKDNALSSLVALLCVFIVGYLSLVGLHSFFGNIVDRLDKAVKNEQARYDIGEYLLQSINTVEKDYYRMAISYKVESLRPIQHEIIKQVNNIKTAINILENGGVLKRDIELNHAENGKIVETIEFYPSKNIKYIFKAAELKPKMVFMEHELKKMDKIIALKESIVNMSTKSMQMNARLEVQLFFKEIPSMFMQLKENTSRLLFDSKVNLKKLKQDIQKEKSYYGKLEVYITLLVIALTIILSYIIIQLIIKRNQELNDMTLKAEESAFAAKRASRVKSQFLANMSHEIRTPLNSIIGFSQLLSRSDLKEQEMQKAVIINKSAKFLLDIINDILDISKVESGKFELSKASFNLKRMLDHIVELFSVSAREKNIEFCYKILGDVPDNIVSDEIRLKQVLTNLISNAIKFTPANKSVVFAVKFLNIKKDVVRLEFSIKDEGIGISKENQKKIFQPFSQADSSISKKFGGTGLGLSISTKILELMGSKIQINSAEGKGSIFSFRADFACSYEKHDKKYTFLLSDSFDRYEELKQTFINIANENAHICTKVDVKSDIDLIICLKDDLVDGGVDGVKNKYKAPVVYLGIDEVRDGVDFCIQTPLYYSKLEHIVGELDSEEKSLSGDKEVFFDGKILVAEDNQNNQLLMQILLEEFGLDIDMVDNGKKAFEKYQSKDYDMVFLDVNMPVLDGMKALKLIRGYEDENGLFTPIVALTANAIAGDKETCLKAGMDEYLSKPIMRDELLAIFEKYLNKSTKRVDGGSIFDKKKISSILGISEVIVDKIIEKFTSNIKDELKDLEDFINTKDEESARKKAHFIKNSCLNVCLDEACEVLERMENSPIKYHREDLEKLKHILRVK